MTIYRGGNAQSVGQTSGLPVTKPPVSLAVAHRHPEDAPTGRPEGFPTFLEGAAYGDVRGFLLLFNPLVFEDVITRRSKTRACAWGGRASCWLRRHARSARLWGPTLAFGPAGVRCSLCC